MGIDLYTNTMVRKEVGAVPCILYEVESSIAHITINREEALNTINLKMVERLQDVINDIAVNPQVGVVIISGAGQRAFSAGGDLHDPAFSESSEMVETLKKLNDLLDSIDNLPQPTIAAINGYAFGAGFELALACDFRIAVDQTLMGLPQTNIGLIPGAGGTQRLPRLIGETKALELILTGKRVTSLDAYQYGFITKVVSNQTLEEEAVNMAKIMLRNGPLALQQAKFAIKNGLKTDIQQGKKIEELCFAKTAASEDFLIGLHAFFEKKPAEFHGK